MRSYGTDKRNNNYPIVFTRFRRFTGILEMKRYQGMVTGRTPTFWFLMFVFHRPDLNCPLPGLQQPRADVKPANELDSTSGRPRSVVVSPPFVWHPPFSVILRHGLKDESMFFQTPSRVGIISTSGTLVCLGHPCRLQRELLAITSPNRPGLQTIGL